jgi:hypothetical protein
VLRVLTVVVSLLVPSIAWAGQARMAWNDCAASGGTQLRAFACDVNTGSNKAVGTFVLDQPMSDFVGVEVVIDLKSAANAMPPWWQFFNPGSCRRISMNATFDFSFLASSECVDPFGQPGQGGLAGYCVPGSNCVDAPYEASRARIKMAGAIADPVALETGLEYYAFILTITNAKTVGADACAGCLEPVCLLLNSIKAAGLNGATELTTVGADPNPGLIGWQCGLATFYNPSAIGVCAGNHPDCESTPVRNPTWGQIKSLWR